MSEQWTVTMPKLGETVTEGTVGSWLKNVGDDVAFDDPLFEVSTDKVDSEIPSPYDGVIVEILVQAGETVPVGTPLVKIGEPGSTPGAGGGPASSDPAAPTTGGSEAMPATAAPGAGVPGSPAAAAPAAAGGEVHDITMPKLGETVTEGTVGSWLKNVGDAVAFDDPLFEVSTDKVDSEIPSPYDGVILEILVQSGETVPVGTPVARIGEPGAAPPAGGGGAPAPTPAAAPAATAAAAPATAAPATASANGGGTPLSPLVRRLAAENNLDLAKVPGSGVGGRIRREDVEKAIAGGGATATAAPAPAAAAAAPATTQPRPAAPAAAAAPKAGGDPRDQVQPLSRMRLALASGLKGSQMLAASVWTSIEVDYDNVDKVRAKHKDRFKKETGSSLSYLPFVSRAVVDALRAFPTVNSSIDVEAKTMTLHPYVNLGIAVDLNQQGLVVPVVKDADQLNMRGIAQGITKIAAAARSGKATMDDMRGSTFTITNPGPFASFASAPIINQPNVGILCTDGVKRRPVAVGDAIAIHPTGVLGLVYDHRAFDGSTASMFLMHIRDSLEKRDWEAEVG
ncbi:2-oxoglutarate dehydrogenase, E2 component, dihydrolipoamide succinyltransferase [Pseudonocardia charpentierae]|uniref:Dihydrolipoamide acetyltransferase component of pyruvate dehydrogenase complex n=1 Tax=Pseudonocardia charpentierae TaxID=3075545 RepID=A0ABU2ND74_9PSEU|nr:2-oxoglutarate dehydrogenase, E2 component, dihydrolipoamide succinyltransferase [Pseudonocardia sp. DSM 45834]MDT0351896.1 2-oxoglutarate dehydrogenase, E2 component, dihydrolipoamide succinyltransferase [Pseudonocardia sp. DSM 45834]